MSCEAILGQLSLYLYGELSFEEEENLEQHVEQCAGCRDALAREKELHAAVDDNGQEPPPELLAACRSQLRARLGESKPSPAGWRERSGAALGIAFWRPVAAAALVALGFFGARWTAPAPAPAEPLATRVRLIEPQGSGGVRIVVDETRQRVYAGGPEEDRIQRLLLAAARDSGDPGLRVESMDLLRTRPESEDVRRAILHAFQYDSNAGVRLKALEGLKAFSGEPEIRKALAQALFTDDNPGVRTQAIDLLVQTRPREMAGTLQELLQREDNNYVRMRCQRALREMNASLGTF